MTSEVRLVRPLATPRHARRADVLPHPRGRARRVLPTPAG